MMLVSHYGENNTYKEEDYLKYTEKSEIFVLCQVKLVATSPKFLALSGYGCLEPRH